MAKRTRHHGRRTSWACLAERVLGGWPMTLRAALLLLIVLAGAGAVLVVVVGLSGTACVAGLGLLVQMVMRRLARPRTA
nr:hypothetical protein [Kibdelosporangium sp. MJ126-NF4]CEL12901.1 hypothetical protein [Kibdelosporangium sp. MJ126-NF4]CTQ98585.1 hypothetical protein [Kibdelosporangium sp. MJ126-NF4]